MYQLNIHIKDEHKIIANYTIGGDLIILVHHGFIDGEYQIERIGLSIDEFLNLAEIIKIRKLEHAKGIEPPENEECDKQTGYGFW